MSRSTWSWRSLGSSTILWLCMADDILMYGLAKVRGRTKVLSLVASRYA